MPKKTQNPSRLKVSEDNLELVFGVDWRKTAEELWSALERLVEVIDGIDGISLGKIDLSNPGDVELTTHDLDDRLMSILLPAHIISLKLSEMITEIEVRLSVALPELDDLSTKKLKLACREISDHYGNILCHYNEALGYGTIDFMEKIEHLCDKENKPFKFFGVWGESSEKAHRDFMLTEKFSKDFGNFLNSIFLLSRLVELSNSKGLE